jgi:hypothetical protein
MLYGIAGRVFERFMPRMDLADPSRQPSSSELEMRKQEYSLYNHLDDEEKLYGQRLLIEYSERRLQRLRDDSSKAICKSRIAHLR